MVSKGIPDCETALTNPMLAVKVGARQWSPVPKTILFFIASFLVVGRSIIRAEGLSGITLQAQKRWSVFCKILVAWLEKTNSRSFANTGYDNSNVWKILEFLVQHQSSMDRKILVESDNKIFVQMKREGETGS